MLPSAPAANGSDRFFAASGYAPPEATVAANLPPPNPALAQNGRMRNRDWTGRESQVNYEMRHAPLPHQYSREAPHPIFSAAGQGNALTQWIPQGQPTGYAARTAPVAYGLPGVQPGMTRPTYAYNRPAQPTMYVTTWPNQYYPGGSNTYIPSWEATGLLVKFTREASRFRINQYLKDLTVKKDTGYYLTLSGQDPYRIVSINDYLWEDGVDAPGGRQERQGFGFVQYKTARYCFPFNLGSKGVEQAEWPILAEHAAMESAKAMTMRTMILTTLATTSANWTGTWGTNFSAASGQWSNMASNTNNYIQSDINTAMIAIEVASGGIVTDEEALHITLNPQEARAIAKSYEYKQYIQGSPDALAAITDQRNPNRRYGLAPYLYGLALVIENAIVVTTPKSGNVPSPPSQTQSYVLNQQYGYISSKPEGIVQKDEQTLDFSTFCRRAYENMTVESKTDPDNRRQIGRVVEDYTMTLQAPQTGYLFTGLT